MLKIYKNKGVSLIELLVAVGLSLTLVLSMLAFYSISSRNVVDFQRASHDQQQIRKMMNLLEADIENTGGFECADDTSIFTSKFMPQAIISLGIGENNDLSAQQIIFVHPIISEYQNTALGMFEFTTVSNPGTLKSFSPRLIPDSGCGQDSSSIYIGTTILEMLPMNNIITKDATYSGTSANVKAFVALSAAQSRRNNNNQNIATNIYTPSIDDATVMFLSDENDSGEISVGKNKVDIFLGFAKEATKANKNDEDIFYSFVPERNINPDSEGNLKLGGWINPFSNKKSFDLLTTDTSDPNGQSKTISKNEAVSINAILHNDSKGKKIESYPLSPEAINQIRAIKFKFTFSAHGDVPERVLTRIIRFKNTHLMKFKD